MLVRFYGENFRSLRDPFELSMVATDLPSESGRGLLKFEMENNESVDLLKTVAIYGANASGKSTLFYAAKALAWMITFSSPEFKQGKSIPPYEPFLLNSTHANKSVKLGVTVAGGDSFVEYEIEFEKNQIINEKLSDYSLKNSLVLSRDEAGKITGSLAEHEVVQLYAKGLQRTVSILSKLAQHGPQEGEGSVQEYFDLIQRSLIGRDYSTATESRDLRFDDPVAERIKDDESFREWVLENMLKPADLGIVELKTKPIDIPDGLRDALKGDDDILDKIQSMIEIEFVHRGESNSQIKFAHESAGTRKLYDISYDWWALTRSETAIFADELTASLHPNLLDRLIKNYNNIDTNSNSQLIFTTHDPGLLESRDGESPALRRDQVYFASKDTDGATSLYSLAEFKDEARSVHNLRKRYLSGRYGGVPLVDSFSLTKSPTDSDE